MYIDSFDMWSAACPNIHQLCGKKPHQCYSYNIKCPIFEVWTEANVVHRQDRCPPVHVLLYEMISKVILKVFLKDILMVIFFINVLLFLHLL